MTTIPQAAPSLRFKIYQDQILASIERVLDRGSLILGAEVDKFEKSFAQYIGTQFAVGVNSGTDAITLALLALGVSRGDEVLTVSLTAAGTGIGILRTGAEPRFVDVAYDSRCMDPTLLETAMSSRVKAIVPVHLHGAPAPMVEIMAFAERYGLWVVEDCAQAHGGRLNGQRVGSFGHAAAFSFYPTKNLGCMGDGGAVLTSSPEVADKVRRLGGVGSLHDSACDKAGFNSKLDEIQAAVLNVLLPDLDAANAMRCEAAQHYNQAFDELPVAPLNRSEGCVYHQYAIEVSDRDGLRTWLGEKGIKTGVHYATGLHERNLISDPCPPLPVTEKLSCTILSLPIQPELMHHQDSVIDAVKQGVCRR